MTLIEMITEKDLGEVGIKKGPAKLRSSLTSKLVHANKQICVHIKMSFVQKK